MSGTDLINPVSHEVFMGVDVMLFENTGSLVFLPWDSDVLSPRSPVAKELHERYIQPDTDRSDGGNDAE